MLIIIELFQSSLSLFFRFLAGIARFVILLHALLYIFCFFSIGSDNADYRTQFWLWCSFMTSCENLPKFVSEKELRQDQSLLDPLPLAELFLTGRSTNTLKSYLKDLTDFSKFVKSNCVNEAAVSLLKFGQYWAMTLALAYKQNMLERRLSSSTINRRLATLRSLVKFARGMGLIDWRLEIESAAPEAYRDTKGPGVAGFRKMVETISARDDPKGKRDLAILRLLFDLALRRAELLALDLSDLDLPNARIKILGKGRASQEWLSLPRPTQNAIEGWISIRGTDPGPLFRSISKGGLLGGRLSSRGLYRVIQALGKAVGLDVHPHGLRHAAITHALDVTKGDVRSVAKFSRHRDIRVLTVYDDNRVDLAGRVASLVSEAE